MKRTLQIVLALAFASLFLISPVAAATSQGLEWGVSVDDELLFHLRIVEAGTVEFDEGLNLTVETTPSIPDPLTQWVSVPDVNVDMVYTNGTAPGLEILILIGLIVVGGYICVPTGNYTLLAELIADNPLWTENHTVINDGTYFGARLTVNDDNETGTVSAKYLKSDGFLAEYSMSVTNGSGITNRATFTRDGLGFDIVGFLTDNALIVGVGVVVLLVVIVLVRRR
jgi:hypothetical protein